MNMQDLPIEILAKIFNYVPKPTKYTVLCKNFYHAICSLPADDRHASIDCDDMRLTSAFLNNLSHYFGQVKVECNYLDEFLIKLGKYFKHLKMPLNVFDRDSTSNDINSILQYIPNCTELEFDGFYEERAKMLPIKEFKVNLPHLKRLNMSVCNFKHLNFIEKVLNEYDLDGFTCNFGTKSTKFISPVIELLLTASKDIKEVKLMGTCRILEYSYDLEKINSLHLHISFDPEEFKGKESEKLTNVKKLTLSFGKDILKLPKIEKCPLLTSSMLANLEYLEIDSGWNEINLDIFADLSEPVLNMKVLIIDSYNSCNHIYIDDTKHLEKILKVFKQLQELKIHELSVKGYKKLNFSELDWKNCYNPEMKILKLDIPQECDSKLIEILKATYPNLTSLQVNKTQYIKQSLVSNDEIKKTISSEHALQKLLLKHYELGSKIDFLRTTDWKFGKLSIEIWRSNFAPENFQYLLDIMHRQGKNIKQLYFSTDITYEVFWTLIALATSCRKIEIDHLNVLDIADHMDDDLAAKFMAPGLVEEMLFDLVDNENNHDAKILNKLISIQPNLKKLMLKNASIENVNGKYFENFPSTCKLEHLEWCIDEQSDSDDEYYDNDDEEMEISWTEQQNVITSIIGRQKKLKTFRAKFRVWDELFTAIANNCKELEEFEFYGAENLTPETFYDIQKLKNLKSLTFGHDGVGSFDDFRTCFTKLSSFLIGIKSLNLTSLSIFRLTDSPPEMFVQLAALVPSLKSLTIEIIECYDYSRHPCSILQHFGYLEELSIDMYCDLRSLQRVYNLEVNPNLKSFSVSSNKVIMTVKDIKNILKANPNLEYLYIHMFMQEHDSGFRSTHEEVTLSQLNTLLKAGKELKSVYISQLIITDSENIKKSQLKKRFKAFEYEDDGYPHPRRQSEIILSSDRAAVAEMMRKNDMSDVLKKAYKQL